MAGAGLLWLSRNFRFSDNPALLAALADGPLIAVFCIDAETRALGAAPRWRLERALRGFDTELRRRSGRGVLVLDGAPELLLPELMRRTGARAVHQADWPAPALRAAQARVAAALTAAGGRLVLHPGHLLIHPARLRTGQGGAYRVYTPFARALRAAGPDRPAPSAPDRIAAFADPPAGLDLARLDLAPDLHRGRAVLDRFALPAGEAAAFDRLDAFLDRAGGYADGRDRPDLEAASGLSEHLATGEIGPRSLWAIAQMRAEAAPQLAGGIGKFLSELIWREFAWHLMVDFPALAERPWRPGWEDFPWQGDNPGFTRWCRAETGIALVDAGLREMRVTGRMHNRVRMVAASWLTKQLLTDWRLGLRHFADSLTDWDPASNALNWQWVAGCGPDATPYFRIFNPDKQAAQYDPDGHYRGKWLATAARGPEALAWLDTVPPGWRSAPLWRPESGSAAARGRARALEAWAAFRGGAA